MNNLYDSMVMAINAYAELSGMTATDVAEECKTMSGPVYSAVLMMVVMVK